MLGKSLCFCLTVEHCLSIYQWHEHLLCIRPFINPVSLIHTELCVLVFLRFNDELIQPATLWLMNCLVFIKEGRICGKEFKRQLLFKDQKHGTASYVFWREYWEKLIFDLAKERGREVHNRIIQILWFSAYWKDTTKRIVEPTLKWIN